MSEEGHSHVTPQHSAVAPDPPAGEQHRADGIAVAILNAMAAGRDRQATEDELLRNFNVSPEVLRVCIAALEEQLRRNDEGHDHATACDRSMMRD